MIDKWSNKTTNEWLSFINGKRGRQLENKKEAVCPPIENKIMKWKRETPAAPKTHGVYDGGLLKCCQCKVGILAVNYDTNGMYMKCSFCNWDSIGLYKIKKYDKP